MIKCRWLLGMGGRAWVDGATRFLGFMLFSFYSVAWGDLGLQNVRMARADVDGDGVLEVIAGGRIGAAVAVDVPRLLRQAGVGVYRVAGDLLQPICERQDLNVVADVAGGDVDGDGDDEVVVVGMGHLRVLDVVGGAFVEVARIALPSDWTDRVMVGDVDGDGNAEVGVTLYAIDRESEKGRSEVLFLQWTGAGFSKKFEFVIDGHVGDLCTMAFEDGRPVVALEVGIGDEGGAIQLLSGQSGQVIWQGNMTDERVRALSLDAQLTQLVIGGIDGRVHLARLSPNGLLSQQVIQQTPGFSGVVWMSQVLLFSNRSGIQTFRF